MAEVAELLQVNERTIRRKVSDGWLTPLQMRGGRKIYFWRHEVIGLLTPKRDKQSDSK